MLRAPSFAAVVLLMVSSIGSAQPKYVDYQDAFTQGAKHLRAGRLPEGQAALEAALTLAKTNRDHFEAMKALIVPYRELPGVERMRTASEYVIRMSTLPAEQSLTRGSLLQFLNKRGKLDEAIKDYEERLEKLPDDRMLLFVLTDAYGRFRNDPKKSAEFGEKLIAVDAKAKIKPDVNSYAEIARQMVLAKRYAEGAKLFEELAGLDESMQAWNLKEAAQAWLKGGDKGQALTAAKKSAAAKPEKRSEQLTYFWQRGLADTFLGLGEPALAIPHYEAALQSTKIEGYKKETATKLAEAKTAAGK